MVWPTLGSRKAKEQNRTELQQWASAKLCGVEQLAPPIFGRATIDVGNWSTF